MGLKKDNRLHNNAIEIFEAYSRQHPQENISILVGEIKNNPDILHRHNLVAHITGSALVTHEGKVLVVWHNFLQRYLQPGGHVDPTDESVMAAAQREALEETGLSLKPHADFNGVPITIKVQDLPDRPERNEPPHKHYDCMFVFGVEGDDTITLNDDGVSEYKWVDTNYAFETGTLQESVKRLLAHKKL